MAYFEPNAFNCSVTDVIKWHWRPYALKYQMNIVKIRTGCQNIAVVLKLWHARVFQVVHEQLSCHIPKALLIRSCVMLMLLFLYLLY